MTHIPSISNVKQKNQIVNKGQSNISASYHDANKIYWWIFFISWFYIWFNNNFSLRWILSLDYANYSSEYWTFQWIKLNVMLIFYIIITCLNSVSVSKICSRILKSSWKYFMYCIKYCTIFICIMFTRYWWKIVWFWFKNNLWKL